MKLANDNDFVERIPCVVGWITVPLLIFPTFYPESTGHIVCFRRGRGYIHRRRDYCLEAVRGLRSERHEDLEKTMSQVQKLISLYVDCYLQSDQKLMITPYLREDFYE